MNVEEHIQHVRELQRNIGPLVRLLILEQEQVAKRSFSADEKRAREYAIKLLQALEALHVYDAMILSKLADQRQRQLLADIDHKTLSVRSRLQHIFENPPQRAAELLLHGDTIERIEELSEEYKEELDRLTSALHYRRN